MKIPELRLGQDEEVLYALRTHPKAIFLRVVLGLILLSGAIWIWIAMPEEKFPLWFSGGLVLVVFGVGFFYSVWPILQWLNKKYVITNKQIVIHEGILIKKTHSSQLVRVSDMNVERGILDRLFNCGTLVVFNAAGGMGDVHETNRVALHDIRNVLDVEQKIKELVFNTPSGNE